MLAFRDVNNSITDILSRGNNQKLGVTPLGMFTKSIFPVKSEELVPPSVKAPPGSRVCAFGSPLKRVRKNPISGVVNELPFARACQNGVAWL